CGEGAAAASGEGRTSDSSTAVDGPDALDAGPPVLRGAGAAAGRMLGGARRGREPRLARPGPGGAETRRLGERGGVSDLGDELLPTALSPVPGRVVPRVRLGEALAPVAMRGVARLTAGALVAVPASGGL